MAMEGLDGSAAAHAYMMEAVAEGGEVGDAALAALSGTEPPSPIIGEDGVLRPLDMEPKDVARGLMDVFGQRGEERAEHTESMRPSE